MRRDFQVVPGLGSLNCNPDRTMSCKDDVLKFQIRDSRNYGWQTTHLADDASIPADDYFLLN